MKRINSEDFLEIKEVTVKPESKKDYDPRYKIDVCFSDSVGRNKGTLLLIDYFMAEELDNARILVVVKYSEMVEPGIYFTGGEIVEIEENNRSKFLSFFSKLISKPVRDGA